MYYHIPKCGGYSVRYWLSKRYEAIGHEWEGKHTPPAEVPDLGTGRAFTVVRHPAYWLRSYHTYMQQFGWVWSACPDEIMQPFLPYKGLEWADFVEAVTSDKPGIVGWIMALYTPAGVEVHRLRSAHYTLGLDLRTHITPGKPRILADQRSLIERAESDMLCRYGYMV